MLCTTSASVVDGSVSTYEFPSLPKSQRTRWTASDVGLDGASDGLRIVPHLAVLRHDGRAALIAGYERHSGVDVLVA